MKHWLHWLGWNMVKLSPFVPLSIRRRAAWWRLDLEWDRLVKQGRTRR